MKSTHLQPWLPQTLPTFWPAGSSCCQLGPQGWHKEPGGSRASEPITDVPQGAVVPDCSRSPVTGSAAGVHEFMVWAVSSLIIFSSGVNFWHQLSLTFWKSLHHDNMINNTGHAAHDISNVSEFIKVMQVCYLLTIVRVSLNTNNNNRNFKVKNDFTEWVWDENIGLFLLLKPIFYVSAEIIWLIVDKMCAGAWILNVWLFKNTHLCFSLCSVASATLDFSRRSFWTLVLRTAEFQVLQHTSNAHDDVGQLQLLIHTWSLESGVSRWCHRENLCEHVSSTERWDAEEGRSCAGRQTVI